MKNVQNGLTGIHIETTSQQVHWKGERLYLNEISAQLYTVPFYNFKVTEIQGWLDDSFILAVSLSSQ